MLPSQGVTNDLSTKGEERYYESQRKKKKRLQLKQLNARRKNFRIKLLLLPSCTSYNNTANQLQTLVQLRNELRLISTTSNCFKTGFSLHNTAPENLTNRKSLPESNCH